MRKINKLFIMTLLISLMSYFTNAQSGIQTAKFRTNESANKQIGIAPKQMNQSSNYNVTRSSNHSKAALTKAYCFVGYDPSSALPNGPAYTFLERPDSIVSIANQSTDEILAGGTWGGPNKWYGAVLNQNVLVTLDTVTGTRTILGNMGVSILGLSYDYSTATLYGISYDGSSLSSLYKINQSNGAATFIGTSLKGVLINLACSASGNLYSVNIANDTLYSINKNTGVATPIDYIGFDASYIQGMEFDRTKNICYMAAYNNTESQGELRTINLSTGATTLIGIFKNKSEITGLAIPCNVTGTINDVAATGIDGKSIMTPKTIKPKASIINKGLNASFNVTMKISDGYSSTLSISNLAPFEDKLLTFDPWTPIPGEYKVTLYTELAGDANTSNDTIIKNISVQILKKVFCNIGYDPTGILPNGPAYTFLQRPDSIVSIANQAAEGLITDGSWGEDKWFGVTDTTLFTINIGSGDRTKIGYTKTSIIGLTYDLTTSSLYGVAYNGADTTSSLYKIDPATATTTLVGSVCKGILINIACDTLGNLYSVNIDNDKLYSINKTTGLGAVIGPIGFDASYLQSMEFNRLTNVCYMAAYNNGANQGELRLVNLTTGATTLYDVFANKCEITALAIPYLSNKITDVATSAILGRPILTPSTVTPKALFINHGVDATFDVTMTISDGYTSTKTVSNLNTFDNIQVSFDPWTANLGEYTITVYAQLAGDINASNDTLKRKIAVQNLEKVYCNIAYEESGTLKNGPAYTFLQRPDSIVTIADQTTLELIVGGTWGRYNQWYARGYDNNTLMTIDTTTGDRTKLSKLDRDITELTFDYTTNTLFGVGNEGAYSNLYRISTATGSTQVVGQGLLNGFFINLACDTLGRLYAVNVSDDKLYSINKTTGATTVIGSIGFDANYLQDMEFNHKTNVCFMAAYNNSSNAGEMRIVDVLTGKTSLIGPFGINQNIEVTGFVIPFNGKTPQTDVGVVSQTSPVDGCSLQEGKVTVKVENMGTDPINNIPVHYSVDGKPPVDTIFSTNIQPSNAASLTFKTPASISSFGIHTIKAYTSLTTDKITYNDTLNYSVTNRPISNIPYKMGFESTESTDGWNIVDANKDGYPWEFRTSGGHDKPYCARYTCNPWASSSDDWLFTKCINLEKGRKYRISFWDKCYQPTWPEKLSVWVFDAPNTEAYVSLITDNPDLTNDTYQETTAKFDVSTTGTYYIGFHVYSYLGLFLYLDDINITDVTGEGIDEMSNNSSFSIFPNPAKDILNVYSNENIKNIRMLNMFGQLIISNTINTTNTTINTTDIEQGVYFLQIETKNGTSSRKVVINK